MAHTICEKTLCTGCGACFAVCPAQCISMVADAEGFFRPQIDDAHCLICDLCKKTCPVANPLQNVAPWPPEGVYAAYALDENTQQLSSSGGIAPLAAETILAQDGAVFGVAFDADGRSVVHICVEDKSQLYRLRGSKYVQTDPSRVYGQVKERLEQGQTVLFTGTPCQIAGLKAFLRQDPSHLITLSVLCHGVPSPLLWSRYLTEEESRTGKRICTVNFRDESTGWHDYRLCLTDEDGTQRRIPPMKSAYLHAFNKNLSLRPSCSNCSFKGASNSADLILGDFWGISEACPAMEHEKGVSLVLIRTEKGRQLWHQLADRVRTESVPWELAVRKNTMAVASAPASPHRQTFFHELEKSTLEKQVRTLRPMTWKERLRTLLPQQLIRLLRK